MGEMKNWKVVELRNRRFESWKSRTPFCVEKFICWEVYKVVSSTNKQFCK